MRRYPSGPYLRTVISALLKAVKVSPVRSYPVILKGKVIGRGDAGNIFSEDMILRDQTGIIFLDYQLPLAIFNIWFALTKLNKFKNEEVVVTGWYRRAPVPYIEVRTIQSKDNRSESYVLFFKMLGWFVLPVILFLVLKRFGLYISSL
ncbi:MAG: hypothetical protein A2Z20_06155 [Bdellovibrionales bacterium RBG_16_40_8]|nr:MAG: hypothetical protein A2Z20_06155 [Bdellovibrionales bacterium RBG_16_40_8]